MTKSRKPATNRDMLPKRLMLAVVLATAGMTSGTVLGHLVVGGGLDDRAGETETFAAFSSNPRALTPDVQPQEPCYNCADSYGVAARLQAERDQRMYASYYRSLGEVSYDDAPYSEDEGDYRYGGNFPEQQPAIAMVSPVQVAATSEPVQLDAAEVEAVPAGDQAEQPLP